MTEEEILAAAKKLHDQRHGEAHCDERYLRSCPRFAQAILDAGEALPETPAVKVIAPAWRGSMAERFGRVETPIPVPADGACGARLHYGPPGISPIVLTCVLGTPHVGMRHRTAQGEQWEVSGAPIGAVSVGTMLDAQAARHYGELLALAAPNEDGALNLGPIIERHREAAGVPGLHHPDVLPLVREVMRLRRNAADVKANGRVAGLARQIEDMRHVFAELLAATCTGCREVAAHSDPDAPSAELEIVEGCPVHGEVAELRRSLAWSAQQQDRIAAALGPEYVAPFGPDIATAAVKCIETARGIDRVLNEAGIDYPLGLRGVADLASLHEGALEHLEERRNAMLAEITATVHYGHTPSLDDCTHHQCMALRKAATA